MTARPARRTAPRADVATVERRHWWSSALAGVAVTALGLGLAGSITSTGHAEPVSTVPVTGTRAPLAPSAGPSAAVDPAVTAPFTFGGDGGEPLRMALVAERAAQRAEELAKSAEAISRAAAEAAREARQDGLTAAEKATQAQGATLAQQALDRAAAARAAAVTARLEAEAAAQAAASSTTETTTTVPGTPALPVTPPLVTSGGGVSPVPGAVVGASFGQYGLWSRYHTGLDFRASYGTPIRAVKAGTVLYAGNSGNWSGNHVAVLHGDGMTTMSSHMSSMAVAAGQTVQAGQVIGYVGQTGRAFGPHLHFELYPQGVRYGDVYSAVDPVPWLRAAGVVTR